MALLLIVGGGNMGWAIVHGAIAHGVLKPHDICVVDIDAEKRARFKDIGCEVAEHAEAGAGRLDQGGEIVLAIKPQMFQEVAAELAPVKEPRVFISIMAGLASRRIHRALGPGTRVVRCMPNVACQIGMGMTAVALGMGTREGDEALARRIFDVLGKTVMVDELLMHAVTAVSGSGPAYVFLLAEAMQAAAAQIDLPHDIASLLVNQTVAGAARMLNECNEDAAALRQSVTSRGGTTEAALNALEGRDFRAMIVKAIAAARDRGAELDQ